MNSFVIPDIIPDRKWYVLHVLTGRELDVKSRALDAEFNCLVPRRKMKERKGGIWKEVEKLLIPGYVFVEAQMTDEEYYRLKGITGVIDILRGASNYPTPLTQDEVQVILSLTKEGDLVGLSDVFINGDKVEIISGPLVGLQGNIKKVDKRRFRAKIAFTLAGQEKTVEIGINVIRKTV